MAENNNIIIKKVKKGGGHGHHGGAWKVAYADFVTAMMAFFLLLWLLNVTTDDAKQGIADYFTPTYGIKDGQGIGTAGGRSKNIDKSKVSPLSPHGIVAGKTPQGPVPDTPTKETKNKYEEDAEQMHKIEEEVNNAFENDNTIAEMRENIIIEHTPEGIEINIVDDKKRAMFGPASSRLMPHTKKILKPIVEIIKNLPNKVVITGHTDSTGNRPGARYGNWELSADRANSTRRFMELNGVLDEQFGKVIGMADRDLFNQSDALDPSNRRVTILILHAQTRTSRGAATSLLSPISSQKRNEDAAQEAPKPDEAPEPAPEPTEPALPTDALGEGL